MREFEIEMVYSGTLLSNERHYVSAADYENAEKKIKEKYPGGTIIKIVELFPTSITTTI